MNNYNFNNELLLKEFPDEDWDYDYLSQNPNITMKDVKENPDIRWTYNSLSQNDFNCDIIVRNRLLKERIKFNIDDLLICIEDIKYRPGNMGYINALNEFVKYKG